jgi:hypothetical protein
MFRPDPHAPEHVGFQQFVALARFRFCDKRRR